MPELIPRRNNFTLVRLLLAFVVLFRHCMDSSVNPAFLGVKGFFASQDAVCLFFAISGMLVTASYERSSSLASYALRRLRRIFPLYLTAVIGAALVLSLASSLPAAAYFTSPAFWRYLFWNAVTLNFMQRTLPGVFEGNPFNSSVNDSLWTVKTELFFYVCLPLISLAVRRFRRPRGRNLFLLALYILSFVYRMACRSLAAALDRPILATLALEAPGYLGAFVLGMLCYYNFDRLARFISSRAAVPCFAGCLALVVLSNGGLLPCIPDLVKYLLLSFLCFYAAFSFRFLHGRLALTDCSYALYLFHYPLLQWMVGRGLFDASPWIALFLCAALAFALALSATRVEQALLRK